MVDHCFPHYMAIWRGYMYMRTYASYGPKNIKSSQKDPIKPKETGPPVLHPDTQPMYPSYPTSRALTHHILPWLRSGHINLVEIVERGRARKEVWRKGGAMMKPLRRSGRGSNPWKKMPKSFNVSRCLIEILRTSILVRMINFELAGECWMFNSEYSELTDNSMGIFHSNNHSDFTKNNTGIVPIQKLGLGDANQHNMSISSARLVI